MSDKKKAQAPHPTSAYQKAEVFTADRETVLLMLYEGSIRFLRKAIEAVEKDDIKERNEYIKKTLNIVIELRSVLDFKAGGAIAENLDRLYEYCIHRLIEGNLKKDTTLLNEALGVLTQLHEAWENAVKELKKTAETNK